MWCHAVNYMQSGRFTSGTGPEALGAREGSVSDASALALDISHTSTRASTTIYDGVSEDLAAWWPRICPGGLLAGHDVDEGAVARAVRHLLLRAAPDATLVVTSDHPASWLFFRPPRPC